MIETINSSDISAIIQHCINAFHNCGLDDTAVATFTEQATDWTISRKLVVAGELTGFYLLQTASVANWNRGQTWADWPIYGNCVIKEDLSRYHGRRGVEGIALVVLPECRGRGYGQQLKALPKALGYDHVFGEHFKASNNLQHWLKRRRLIAECEGIWVTLQDL